MTKQEIDRELLDEAMKLGKLPTVEATIDKALREFIQCRNQPKIPDRFCTTEFDPPTNSEK